VQTALGGYQSIREIDQSRRSLVRVAARHSRRPSAKSRYLQLAPTTGSMYAFMSASIRTVLPQFDDQQFALDLLEQKHVLVAPGVSFNVPYRSHFRVTTLPDAAMLRVVFARIEELLTAYASRDTEGRREPRVVDAQARFK
jgi:alanine-synthesizing transaminase